VSTSGFAICGVELTNQLREARVLPEKLTGSQLDKIIHFMKAGGELQHA